MIEPQETGGSKVEMYIMNDALMVSAQNLPEFKKLLCQASEQAAQLNDTLSRLSRFDFSIQLSVRRSDQTGDMDAASSTISDMPMK